jgi:glycosyltransferase involved in cell wall biosynthesis
MNKLESPSANIVLTMIVKNEENVIERCLNSIYSLIDAYVVVDTGSTDKTKEIVEDFFKEKNIPGRVVDHPWINFGDARNRSINEANKLAIELNLENAFGFWQDADEQLIYDKNFESWLFKRKLVQFDAANVKVTYGAQHYHRMQFYKLNDGWRFEGPLHEVLVNDREDIKSAIIDGFNVLVTADGNSWTSQTIKEKYEGHAKILEDYVANDPKKDARWVFYLAQSYRDCENIDKAIEWYTKRAETLTGYWEEIYYSRYMVASLKAKRNDPIYEVMEAYRRCGQTNMYRVEHLLPLILYYQSIKDYDTAYIYSSHAMKYAGKSPSPKSNLFIDVPFYLWKIYDLHCISSWYSGRKEESSQTYKKLWKMVEKGLVEEPDLTRIKENKKFFLNLKK